MTTVYKIGGVTIPTSSKPGISGELYPRRDYWRVRLSIEDQFSSAIAGQLVPGTTTNISIADDVSGDITYFGTIGYWSGSGDYSFIDLLNCTLYPPPIVEPACIATSYNAGYEPAFCMDASKHLTGSWLGTEWLFEINCGGYCQNIVDDTNNCGRCGNVCNIGQGFTKCYMGTCISDTYSVPGKVLGIAQLTEKDCWAASATMLYNWMISQELGQSIPPILFLTSLDILGPEFDRLFQNHEGINKPDMDMLIGRLGFSEEPNNSPTVLGWLYLLTRYGSLWVNVDSVVPGYLHGNIVIGIRSDYKYDPDNTVVYFIDAGDGGTYSDLFQAFLGRYTRGASTDTISIIHAK